MLTFIYAFDTYVDMSISFNPFRFNKVASGEASYRSLAGLHAQQANRFAMSCPGARHAQRYTIAGTSGGLSAAPRVAP